MDVDAVQNTRQQSAFHGVTRFSESRGVAHMADGGVAFAVVAVAHPAALFKHFKATGIIRRGHSRHCHGRDGVRYPFTGQRYVYRLPTIYGRIFTGILAESRAWRQIENIHLRGQSPERDHLDT